jgi:hypothetical protein
MILPFLMAMLASRVNRRQNQVIRYLGKENRILKAKLQGKRMQLTDTERRRLAVLAHPIERKHLQDVATIATADTLQRWYRRLVVQTPPPTPQGKRLRRLHVAAEIEQLIIRMATENPRWGSRRMQGTLANLSYHIDNTTVRNILRRNHIVPAPIRGNAGMSWSQFVTLHPKVFVASGFCEARLSAIVALWTVVTLFGRNLSAWGVERLGLLRRGAMNGLALVAQQGRVLWSGCLTYVDARCNLIVGRRRPVPDGAFPRLRLVSSQLVFSTIQAWLVTLS